MYVVKKFCFKLNMSNKTILDLNDYCFYNILAYLDKKDHVNFSQVCQRFRQVFVTWSAKQYKVFRALSKNVKMFFIASENIEKLWVNLNDICNILKGQSCVHQQIMIRNFCKQFQNMKALKHLELSFNKYCCKILTHLNICDEMVKFLKDLPHLAELKIDFTDYNLNAFCELKLLTSFSAYVADINVKELCKSNENLSFLKVMFRGEYDGNISDIVPFCSNLKTLEFNTLQKIDNYAALGKLPQLQVLKINDFINGEEMKQMCQKFASKNLLRELVLFNLLGYMIVDLEGTKEICKIKSLNILQCEFENDECIKYVAQLTNLKKLTFNIRDNSVDFSDSLCHILRECKQMEYMRIHAASLPQNFAFQAFKVLEVVRNPQEQEPLQLSLSLWKYDLASQDKDLYKSYVHFLKK